MANSWYKITLELPQSGNIGTLEQKTAEQVLAPGERSSGGRVPGAAVFAEELPGGESVIYVSPAAAAKAMPLLNEFRAVPCSPPRSLERLVLLQGDERVWVEVRR